MERKITERFHVYYDFKYFPDGNIPPFVILFSLNIGLPVMWKFIRFHLVMQ